MAKSKVGDENMGAQKFYQQQERSPTKTSQGTTPGLLVDGRLFVLCFGHG